MSDETAKPFRLRRDMPVQIPLYLMLSLLGTVAMAAVVWSGDHNAVAEHETKIANLETQTKQLQGELAGLRGELGALRGEVRVMSNNIDWIRNALDRRPRE